MADTTILGFTLKQWDSFLDGPDAENTEKALKYYDGDQEQEIISVLSDPSKGRRNWKERGFIPRYRNLVKPIVSHSGMLFKDAPPVLGIYNKDSITVNESATAFLQEELSKIEWTEFCITLDEVTRLVKTTLILTQYDINSKELVHTILHKGNSAVILDTNYKDVIGLIYETTDDNMRIYTNDFIYDVQEEKEQYSIIAVNPNPYGIIPVTPVHDTNIPRVGYWNQPGMDLINVNEMLNLHLTDTEFALKWAKLPTLFTNCTYSGNEDTLAVTHQWGQKLPTLSADTSAVIGGPGQAVLLDSNGVDSPFAEYKAPVFDVTSMDNVVNSWLYNVAQDWSVRLDVQGQGRANSALQVIVEELPNLELRKQRQKMMSSAFKKWYKVVARVLNVVNGTTKLPEDAELYVEFQTNKMTIDEKQDEEIWSLKIKEGRASLVDYFMEVKGLTKDEAEQKIQEIKSYNSIVQQTI